MKPGSVGSIILEIHTKIACEPYYNSCSIGCWGLGGPIKKKPNNLLKNPAAMEQRLTFLVEQILRKFCPNKGYLEAYLENMDCGSKELTRRIAK